MHVWCISWHTGDYYHFLCHDREEVGEGDFSRAILIHFTDHLLDLFFLRLKPQSSHGNLAQCEKGGVKHRQRTATPTLLTHVDCTQSFSTFTLSSLTSMYPDPSVSNSSKASRISCFCSSVSSGLGVVFLRGGGTGPCRDGLLALVAWWGHRRGEKSQW